MIKVANLVRPVGDGSLGCLFKRGSQGDESDVRSKRFRDGGGVGGSVGGVGVTF